VSAVVAPARPHRALRRTGPSLSQFSRRSILTSIPGDNGPWLDCRRSSLKFTSANHALRPWISAPGTLSVGAGSLSLALRQGIPLAAFTTPFTIRAASPLQPPRKRAELRRRASDTESWLPADELARRIVEQRLGCGRPFRTLFLEV
jgi:hypothetical protein